MNQYFNTRVAQKTAKILDIIFLIMHMWLLYFFYKNHITIMVCMNILSIALYVVGFVMADSKWVNIFMYMLEGELFVHEILATICVGLEPGFQWVLLFQPIAFYYTDYFSLQIRDKTAHAKIGSICSFLGFLFVEIYLQIFGPIYKMDVKVEFPVRIILISAIFVVEIFILHSLVKLSYTSEKKLREKASIDALTGLYNRFEFLNEMDHRRQLEKLDNAWIAILDIDNFKRINDTYGHNVGDYILVQIAQILHGCGDELTCARWGGDQFIICGTKKEKESEASVLEYIDVLCKTVENIKFEIMEDKLKIRMTVGVSFYQKDDSVKHWIGVADKKMFAGKYNGKNLVIS